MVSLDVNGKSVLITGGSRGLGLHCAEVYVLNGARRVVITSRKEDQCMKAVQYLKDLSKTTNPGVEIGFIAADLSTDEGAKKLKSEYQQRYGNQLNILVANAGATWGASFEGHSRKAIDKVLGLNVAGVFQTIQLFAAFLEKAGTPKDPSRVLIMSSVAGLTTSFPAGGTYGYLASKAAVSHLGKTLAVELGPRNITVNVLAPGFFPTKMSNGLLDVVGEQMVKNNPRQRLGEKKDIQYLVLYLSSSLSNYVNGAVIPLDGGSHLVGLPKL
ncbi:BA75_05012T0 [Komagataella pastoris]|uniref:BA75_05012T0 n=1 Tax=Komagataella pastoris TaxID=4922 RepID=A0A1B2JHU2_PICPA|nr:BA75_05012T0 [Komagataella pastoris]